MHVVEWKRFDLKGLIEEGTAALDRPLSIGLIKLPNCIMQRRTTRKSFFLSKFVCTDKPFSLEQHRLVGRSRALKFLSESKRRSSSSNTRQNCGTLTVYRWTCWTAVEPNYFSEKNSVRRIQLFNCQVSNGLHYTSNLSLSLSLVYMNVRFYWFFTFTLSRWTGGLRLNF